LLGAVAASLGFGEAWRYWCLSCKR
jgi:hypothetical protein